MEKQNVSQDTNNQDKIYEANKKEFKQIKYA